MLLLIVGDLIQVIKNGSIEIWNNTLLTNPKTEAAFALSVINTCANVILMITQIISVGIICKCINYNKPNYANYD